MGLWVVIENIMVITLVMVVILSFFQKVELKRNLFICLIFYIGLTGQYFLKEHQLGVLWFLFFASISFIGMTGLTIIKFENIKRLDMILISLFFVGIPRNWLMHYDRYYIDADFFLLLYKVSGQVIDITMILIISWPLVNNLIGAILKRRSKDGHTAH